MTNIIQSFIFAAGRGERMRPFTDSVPKPLAPIGQKPILGHIIEKLDQIDSIQNIVVNGHYLADQIEHYLSNLSNSKINFSLESEKLETGGGLVFAAQGNKFDQNQPLLLINGDILWNESGASEIEGLASYYYENNCDIVLGLTKTEKLFGYEGQGDFNLKKNGDLEKSQQNSYTFTGLAIINPKILKFAPSKCFSMGYFYNNFKELGLKIKGLGLNSQFFHIGDVKSLGDVNSRL